MIEPVAWATEDGRVSMAKTRDTCMPSAAKESFNIPLYAIPEGYTIVPVEQVKDAEKWNKQEDFLREHSQEWQSLEPDGPRTEYQFIQALLRTMGYQREGLSKTADILRKRLLLFMNHEIESAKGE